MLGRRTVVGRCTWQVRGSVKAQPRGYLQRDPCIYGCLRMDMFRIGRFIKLGPESEDLEACLMSSPISSPSLDIPVHNPTTVSSTNYYTRWLTF
jgi:hypothetical protein